MNWYIFLTPLLLLPIIFLFRLVGCGLDTSGIPRGDGDDGDDGGPLEINISFELMIADAILPIAHNDNLIQYIWPMFTIAPYDGSAGEPIGYAGGSPQQMFPQTNPAGVFNTPFTITSDKVPVQAGTYTCFCDVYITRSNDVPPDQPLWDLEHHLIGAEQAPQTEFQSDIVLTFILNYTPTEGATDYLASDFLLTPPPIAPS
jgi:hypothetical protein